VHTNIIFHSITVSSESIKNQYFCSTKPAVMEVILSYNIILLSTEKTDQRLLMSKVMGVRVLQSTDMAILKPLLKWILQPSGVLMRMYERSSQGGFKKEPPRVTP
jgi:hypothetical protein